MGTWEGSEDTGRLGNRRGEGMEGRQGSWEDRREDIGTGGKVGRETRGKVGGPGWARQSEHGERVHSQFWGR